MNVMLIRHGETKGNLEKRYVGRTDEELTESCVEALSGTGDLGPGLFPKPVKTIYVSPMRRCLMTKELLFPKENYPDVKTAVVEEFRECDFGEFEYKNYRELSGNAAYEHFIETMGAEGFPGGETAEEFKRRCVLEFQKIVLQEFFSESGRDGTPGLDAAVPGIPGALFDGALVFVVHGGTIMSVMEKFARPKADYYSWQVKNLEGFSARVTLEGGRQFCLTDVAKICIL